MAAVHILCLRQNNAGLKVLSNTQCDFNSIATNITFLHMKFLTDHYLCGEENEKLFGTKSDLTPLHIASLLENEAVIQSLLRKTDKTDIICRMFPLHIKFRYNENIAQLITSNSSFKLTAFHIACLLENDEIAELLIRRRANLYVPAILRLELKQLEEIVISTHSELSSLHLACLTKNVAYPLHICTENGNIEQCKVLLDHGADTSVETSFASLQPWHLALFHAHNEILSMLLEKLTKLTKQVLDDDSLDKEHEYATKSTDDSLYQEHEYDTKSIDDCRTKNMNMEQIQNDS
ncbi:ANK [Mytilus edulis]|uniref:ANK n=1 Tax=Mytilus edulis TaxID=6550 RepID=A0A8S3R1N9_MYTED|nr:ANK [Mytilus edulis]